MPQLPLRIDLFAILMLLGVAQGLFLGLFFLTGSRASSVSNRCLGWVMLALSAIGGEIFLDYSNYTFRVLWLVDFAEPFNFLPGPLFFGFVYSRIHRQLPRFWQLHLVPFGVWVANAVTWLYQPTVYKYNSYVESVHPEMPFMQPWTSYMDDDFTGLRDYINEMTLLSCLLYSLAALWVIGRGYRRAGQSFFGPQPVVLAQLRNLTSWFLVLPVLVLIVKPNYEEDLGDYWLACYITLTIYATSVLVMSGSDFLHQPPVDSQPASVPAIGSSQSTDLIGGPSRKKYSRSALSDEVEQALLDRFHHLMNAEKPYLESDLSLPKLARRLDTSPHHLSQLLNDRLGQNFFDVLATRRVDEARHLLQDRATAHLKIDEIAERVGYNSPSAFHTAFKRLTGQTPAQFRDTTASSRSARTS